MTMTDAKRLEWLEKTARESRDGLLLHAIQKPTGRLGLGLNKRTLRQAIDDASGARTARETACEVKP